MQNLTLDANAVYVDGAGYEPGEHTVEVEATLPAGVEVVKRDPATVRLEIRDPEAVRPKMTPEPKPKPTHAVKSKSGAKR